MFLKENKTTNLSTSGTWIPSAVIFTVAFCHTFFLLFLYYRVEEICDFFSVFTIRDYPFNLELDVDVEKGVDAIAMAVIREVEG